MFDSILPWLLPGSALANNALQSGVTNIGIMLSPQYRNGQHPLGASSQDTIPPPPPPTIPTQSMLADQQQQAQQAVTPPPPPRAQNPQQSQVALIQANVQAANAANQQQQAQLNQVKQNYAQALGNPNANPTNLQQLSQQLMAQQKSAQESQAAANTQNSANQMFTNYAAGQQAPIHPQIMNQLLDNYNYLNQNASKSIMSGPSNNYMNPMQANQQMLSYGAINPNNAGQLGPNDVVQFNRNSFGDEDALKNYNATGSMFGNKNQPTKIEIVNNMTPDSINAKLNKGAYPIRNMTGTNKMGSYSISEMSDSVKNYANSDSPTHGGEMARIASGALTADLGSGSGSSTTDEDY